MTSNTTQPDALLDELLKGYTNPKDILGEHGLLKQLTRRLVERALEAEMTAHLGYAPHALEGRGSGNSRNGKRNHSQVGNPLPTKAPRRDSIPDLLRATGFLDQTVGRIKRSVSGTCLPPFRLRSGQAYPDLHFG